MASISLPSDGAYIQARRPNHHTSDPAAKVEETRTPSGRSANPVREVADARYTSRADKRNR
jgi:hypothetical protein